MDQQSSGGLPSAVVGLGASAGGLNAYKQFFAHMPADSGMAFVLVQHLDPDHASALTAIIATFTPMEAHGAEDGARVEANHIYVIPPDAILTMEGHLLRLRKPAPLAARRSSIDTFFISLAAEWGDKAAAVVLAGFGNDGAQGVAAIKERGGLTLSEAEFDHHPKRGMPQSAAAGGFVDHVLPASDMPRTLIRHLEYRLAVERSKGPDGILRELESHLSTICAILNSRLGKDFSRYKTGTLVRRLRRRMHVTQLADAQDYVEYLRSSETEVDLLFRELLIGVTRFFRDPDVFDSLEATIIPAMIGGEGDDEALRIWVAGCATGEEAYSMAILLREAIARSGRARTAQIFATDIDDRAIEVARSGLYAPAIASDLTPARLEAHFVREQGGYRVSKELREMCLFSTHDLVKDPPFSRMHLISCRNLMIYFDTDLQQRVLTTFHYALQRGGYLLLGPSESASAQPRFFVEADKGSRIYRKQDVASHLPPFPLSRHLPISRQDPRHPVHEIDRRVARAAARYMPAYLVVDQNLEVIRFSGDTARFLEPSSGIASLHLFNLLHPDLRAATRSALQRDSAAPEEVVHRRVWFGPEHAREAVLLVIEPLEAEGSGAPRLFMITFQTMPRAFLAEARNLPDAGRDGDSASLRSELAEAREQLGSLTRDLEAANQELRASNEESLAVNEELRSANEELEASREELQSLNEELQTINAELNNRNDSLLRSNSDLANLFDSTSVATLFLDKALCIRRFTPGLTTIFKLRDGDEGRPITDIVSMLKAVGFAADVREVLASSTPLKREVMLADSEKSFLMQIRPYLDLNHSVDGAAITFVDISERKEHERDAALLASIVASSHDAIISYDLGGSITSWNTAAEALYGHAAPTMIGTPIEAFLLGETKGDWLTPEQPVRHEESIERYPGAGRGKDGQPLEVALTLSPIRTAFGELAGGSVIVRDISARKEAERVTRLLIEELHHRVRNALAIVSSLVRQTLKSAASPEAFVEELDGRIAAISETNKLLNIGGDRNMLLADIFRIELAPYQGHGRRIAMQGPSVRLESSAALAIAMAVHELASNAAKYGALSVAGGNLQVGWSVRQEGELHHLEIVWTESGGPPVQAPTRRGFGTALIERALSHGYGAEVARLFEAGGVSCRIAMPLSPDVGALQPSRD